MSTLTHIVRAAVNKHIAEISRGATSALAELGMARANNNRALAEETIVRLTGLLSMYTDVAATLRALASEIETKATRLSAAARAINAVADPEDSTE